MNGTKVGKRDQDPHNLSCNQIVSIFATTVFTWSSGVLVLLFLLLCWFHFCFVFQFKLNFLERVSTAPTVYNNDDDACIAFAKVCHSHILIYVCMSATAWCEAEETPVQMWMCRGKKRTVYIGDVQDGRMQWPSEGVSVSVFVFVFGIILCT